MNYESQKTVSYTAFSNNGRLCSGFDGRGY